MFEGLYVEYIHSLMLVVKIYENNNNTTTVLTGQFRMRKQQQGGEIKR